MLLASSAVLLSFTLVHGQEEEDVVDIYTAPRGVVAPLNRVTFGGNVLAEDAGTAQRWFVLFCVDWYEPCANLKREWAALGSRHDAELNSDRLFSSFVRFAGVDCATDKELCNEQHIDTYPMVVHYLQGRQAAVWEGIGTKDLKRLTKFVEKELKRDPSRASGSAGEDGIPVAEALRLLVLVVMVAAFMTSYFRVVAAIVAQLRRKQTDEPDKTAAQDAAMRRAESEAPSTRLECTLPSAWGRERGSMEL